MTHPAMSHRDVAELPDELDGNEASRRRDELEREKLWDTVLSGGEKQRLAFARVLLHKPEIVVLDEATSALDPKNQDALMALLAERLIDATIISVGHRPELGAFHDRKIVLARRHHGAKLISDLPLPKGQRSRERWLWRARNKVS